MKIGLFTDGLMHLPFEAALEASAQLQRFFREKRDAAEEGKSPPSSQSEAAGSATE